MKNQEKEIRLLAENLIVRNDDQEEEKMIVDTLNVRA